VTAASLEPNLQSSLWIFLPDLNADSSKVRHNPILFAITSLKKTKHPTIKARTPSMSELIPQSAAAIVADLASAQVWPMLILTPVFVVLVNRLNRLWRGHWLKVH
jgi:hypothetical protein